MSDGTTSKALETSIIQGESKVVGVFVNYLHKLLQSFSVSFAECEATQNTYSEFKGLVVPNPEIQLYVISEWHKQMNDHYDACLQKVPFFMNTSKEIPLPKFISRINMADKWTDPTFDDESREILWEYLNYLNVLAFFHFAIPKKMMSACERMAMQLCYQNPNLLNNPTVPNLRNVNLIGMVQEIMGSIEPDEWVVFVQHIERIMSMLRQFPKLGETLGASGALEALSFIGGAGKNGNGGAGGLFGGGGGGGLGMGSITGLLSMFGMNAPSAAGSAAPASNRNRMSADAHSLLNVMLSGHSQGVPETTTTEKKTSPKKQEKK